MIHCGATNWTAKMNAVTTSQHQSQASAPVHSKNRSTAPSTIPPSRAMSAMPLNRSAANVATVVRLKPKRCSITKVE